MGAGPAALTTGGWLVCADGRAQPPNNTSPTAVPRHCRKILEFIKILSFFVAGCFSQPGTESTYTID
jgi:hypothetical protein